MYCKECGKQIEDGALFCPHCGVKQGIEQDSNAGQKSEEIPVEPVVQVTPGVTVEPVVQVTPGAAGSVSTEKTPGRKVPVAAIAAGLVALTAVIGVGAFFLVKGLGKDEKDASAISGGKDKTVQEETEETPLYSNVQPGVIDLYAENVQPGGKAAGMGWDNTLFYWLEDCDTTSDADGNIARCRITKTQMILADGGKPIQYEIYRDPDTDVIYKIVSIRGMGTDLTLTDYYYQDGKPNFIFERNDSVYTPTYATIDKVGERYYFNNDVMVRWRMIREPQQIGEYTLNPSEVWYSQADYFAESDQIREIYDNKEREMLNRAYNTWNAVMSDRGIGTVEGYVKDTSGTPVSGAVVNIYRKTDGVLLYQMTTGEDGRFQAYVYLDGEECFFTVTGDETVYKAAVVNGLNLTDNSMMHSYDNLVLHKVSGDEYQVHLDVHAANEAKANEDGSVSCENLRGVTVNFREGSDSREGEILLTSQAAENGELLAKLPSGTYTAELVTDGYITTWMNIEVPEQETWCSGWMIPATAENQTAVLLTWEGEDTDLDLTVFTPNQSTAGDMAHVGGSITSDGRGNLLISDNPSGCEIIYLNTGDMGAFKIFVSDYTNSLGGNYSADRLASLNVHIYIYNSNGLVEDYAYPAGQNGVVWEVAEVNGRTVTPSQRTYTEISGKNWWTTNKSGASEEELIAALQEGNNLHTLLRDIAHEYIYDACSIDAWGAYDDTRYRSEEEILTNVNRLLGGDSESILEFLGLYGELPPHCPPVETSELPMEYSNKIYALDKEQLEYAAYSLTGQHIGFDIPSGNEYGDGTCIYFGGWAGDITWNEVHNITVEYTGGNVWRVGADVWFGSYGEDIDANLYEVAKVTFLITGDSGSCYDGFRVLKMESVHLSEWRSAYIEILKNAENANSYGELKYNLIYLDDDYIPELVVDDPGYYLSVYSYSSGEVYTVIDGWEYGTWGRYYEYQPYTGKVIENYYEFQGEETVYHCDVYCMYNEHQMQLDNGANESSESKENVGENTETQIQELCGVVPVTSLRF